MSEELVLAAVIAKLRVDNPASYGLNELKTLATLPVAYNEVHVSELMPTAQRADGVAASNRYAIFVRSVAQRYVNAQRMREAARASLLHQFVTVGDAEGGIDRAIPDDLISPDDGWFSGTSEYVTAI